MYKGNHISDKSYSVSAALTGPMLTQWLKKKKATEGNTTGHELIVGNIFQTKLGYIRNSLCSARKTCNYLTDAIEVSTNVISTAGAQL